MTAKVTEMLTKGLETYKRFPLALFSSLVMTVIAIYFIGYEPKKLEGLTLALAKLATTAMLGVFVFSALRLLEHSVSKRTHMLVLALGFVGLVGYYVSLPSDIQGFDTLFYVFRHIFLLLLFLIAIFWTPFVNAHLSNVDYWAYVKGVILALLMTLNFTIVIVLGVNVALYAVEELFGFNVKGKYYMMLDVFIIGVFSVAYFLSQIPSQIQSIKAILPPPRVEKFFTLYVLTPLAGLYFIILYAYTAKILMSADWPKGLLAWLIVAFSAVAVLTYLFWTHFAAEQTSKWRRWIWLAIFVQTLLLFVAVSMRIAEYSWTENRYMVLFLGVWLAGNSLYFLVKKEAKIKWIFVSLSLLIAISQVGPLSAYNVSQKAQATRLESLLTEFRGFKPEDVKQKVTAHVRYEISDVTQYLFARYGLKGLEPIFPKITSEFKVLDEKFKEAQKALDIKLKKGSNGRMVMPVATREEYKKIENIFKDKPRHFPYFVTHELGFKFLYAWDYNNERKYPKQNDYLQVGFNGTQAFDIRGYDYMGDYYGDTYSNDIKQYFENIGVTVTFEGYVLTVQKGTDKIVIDLDTYIKEMIKKYGNRAQNLTQRDLTIEKENEKLKMKVEFRHLQKNDSSRDKSIRFSARILFKFKGEE
jgi:hypothetical protein